MPFPLYPLLFAFYPVFALLAQNISQVAPIALVRPIIFSLLFTLLVWGLAAWLTRNRNKAALLTFAIQGVFFSFGPILRTTRDLPALSAILGRDRYLALVDVIFLAVFIGWLLRSKAKFKVVTTFLT
jgi:hypothetical protein